MDSQQMVPSRRRRELDPIQICRVCERWLCRDLDFYPGRRVCIECYIERQLDRYHARKTAA